MVDNSGPKVSKFIILSASKGLTKISLCDVSIQRIAEKRLSLPNKKFSFSIPKKIGVTIRFRNFIRWQWRGTEMKV